MSIRRQILEQFLNELLQPVRYQDYGPNGLQVEGREDLTRIAFAVSATLESIGAAIAMKADALVVHHGILWNFHGVRPICGPFGRRIRALISSDMNLFAYHLPLDGHLEIGNAACIARILGMEGLASFGDYQGMPTGVQGSFSSPLLPGELKLTLEKILCHPVLLSTHNLQSHIRNVGIITGGANGGWKDAAAAGLDAYITGEMSEHDFHEAQEAGVHMFAGGHYATEVFGIRRLVQEVQTRFSVPCFFINSENPA